MISKCSTCGDEMNIGDWPFCSGPGSHGSIFHRSAQGFDPIRVYEQPDGSLFFPGRNDGSDAPAGAKPIDITTLQQWDKIEARENARQDSLLRDQVRAKQQRIDQTVKTTREQLYAELDKRGISRKNADEIIRDRDERRAKARFFTPRANFTSEVFSQDSSNREAHRDADTGWKGRKA
jgi:hypothetical protein